MGRSKFPGKPSKHVNKQRVNVLSCAGNKSNNSEQKSLLTENIIVGVSSREESKFEDKNQTSSSKVSLNEKPINSDNLCPKQISSRVQQIFDRRARSAKVKKKYRLCDVRLRTRTSSRDLCHTELLTDSNLENDDKPESVSFAGKFVLPHRSAHSSRVIKPNKRFMDGETKSNSTSPLRSPRKAKSSDVLESVKTSDEGANNENNKKECDSKCSRQQSDESGAESSEGETEIPAQTGKLVLRQAKLQLRPCSGINQDGGPFSSPVAHGHGHGAPPGTVTCGVCGAVRFYRFVKQARKFNIYSCESCRKFISKMIKRQACQRPIQLVCQRGQGTCHVPPIVRSQHWRLLRCAYKARCPACWLKMCLRSFHMPVQLRASLAQMLPAHMRTSSDVTPAVSSNPLSEPPRKSSAFSLAFTSICKPVAPTFRSTFEDAPCSKKRRSRTKLMKKTVDAIPDSVQVTNQNLRQKLDLKGPRVKHVCRSASIVLGQPLAIFQKENNVVVPVKKELVLEVEQSVECFDENNKNICDDCSLVDNRKYDVAVEICDKSKDEQIIQEERVVRINREFVPEVKLWSRDPAIIREHGFGLIMSKDVLFKPLCFLCGSAGNEELLYCCVCCEPYHGFCCGVNATAGLEGGWVCSRCSVTCTACSEPVSSSLTCISCRRLYHVQCLLPGAEMLCNSCLRCADCGRNEIAKSLGKKVYCSKCFKSKCGMCQCPVCKQTFESNCTSKVLECSKCKRLVHADCACVSEEQYTMLHTLSVYEMFSCDGCGDEWREALGGQLVYGCLSVLRSLAEHRVLAQTARSSAVNNVQEKNNVPRLKSKQDFETKRQTSDVESDDDKKIVSALKCDNMLESKCKCTETLSLLEMKRNIVSKKYYSLQHFRHDLILALKGSGWYELLDLLDDIMRKVFPWFKINSDISCTQYESPVAQNSEPDDQTDSDGESSESDVRRCSLCSIQGDRSKVKEGRLLYCGPDIWIHVACALWSVGIHETLDGALLGVTTTVGRARLIKCSVCKMQGASVDCAERSCTTTYHLGCARKMECRFLANYRMFCEKHSQLESDTLVKEDFAVQRPVYVHTDLKQQWMPKHDNLQFMVGSLVIKHLGTYVPNLSDFGDVIIPSGLVCTKLFWSTVEPWKVIQYTITTFIVSSQNSRGVIDCEKNITVDHSSDIATVTDKLDDIKKWFHELEICEQMLDCGVDDEMSSTDVIKISREVLNSLIDAVCSKEEESEEEPQNNTDILPPEIKDAIFEDLPHDVLDGISMQDIFPKLMSYDDLITVDLRNEACYKDESREDGNTDDLKNDDCDRSVWTPEETSDNCLKRSKSEVLPYSGNNTLLSKNRGHQRSCSLTWSCKLSNSSNNLKKRKISCVAAEVENNVLMLMDDTAAFMMNLGSHPIESNGIKSRVGLDVPAVSENKIKENLCMLRRRILQVDGVNDLSSSDNEDFDDLQVCVQKYPFGNTVEGVDEPVKCERCQCTYRTPDSYTRHLAQCETMSTSESESETLIESENQIIQTCEIKTDTSETMVTEITYQSSIVTTDEQSNLQSTQFSNIGGSNIPSVMISSQSTSQYTNQSTGDNLNKYVSVNTFDNQPMMSMINTVPPLVISQTCNGNDNNLKMQKSQFLTSNVLENQMSLPGTNTISSLMMPSQQCTLNENSRKVQYSLNALQNQSNTSQVILPSQICSIENDNFKINKSNTMSNICEKLPHVTAVPSMIVNSQPNYVSNTNIKIQNRQYVTTNGFDNSLMVPAKPVSSLIKRRNAEAAKSRARNRALRRPLLSKIKILEKQPLGMYQPVTNTNINQPTYFIQPQPVQNKQQMFFIQQPMQSVQQMQPVQSIGILPNGMAYANSDPMHTNLNNIQYVLAPNIDCSNVFNNTQLLNASNSLVSGPTFQVHPNLDSVGLIGYPQSLVVQPQVQMQPQMVLNSTPCVYLSASPNVQPVLYGLETVVQNTVMSTQQLVSTVVPGQVVAHNSSFSATTQVFQTSTFHEPAVVDMQLLGSTEPNCNTQNNVTQQAFPLQQIVGCSTANHESVSSAGYTPKPVNSTLSVPHINLPIAPNQTTGIPTNIVTPTPQVKSSPPKPQIRPMNRVLPMTACPVRPTKVISIKPTSPVSHLLKTDDTERLHITDSKEKSGNIEIEKGDSIIKNLVNAFGNQNKGSNERSTANIEIIDDEKIDTKLENTSLKLVFQKQSQEGVYKISNIKTNNISEKQDAFKVLNNKTDKDELPVLSDSCNLSMPSLDILELPDQISGKKTKTENLKPQVNGKKNEILIGNNVKLSRIKLDVPNKKLLKSFSKNGIKSNVIDKRPKILFKIQSQDGFTYTSQSLGDLWGKLITSVKASRLAHDMPPLPQSLLNEYQALGLKNPTLKQILEEMKRLRLAEEDETEGTLQSSVAGAARCGPYSGQRTDYDMFSWLASRHRRLAGLPNTDIEGASRRASSMNFPMAMRYKNLKETSKRSVGVYRSNIHGRGLFCLRDIELGEMVIEYAGEVIRSSMTDVREKYYNSKGIGCYMFRIDDNLVVDATVKGNAARFINHSCDPNCYSRVLEILGHKHILIFALRRILRGEELTYDYKFPFEEDKIPCTCGARRCRKYLN